MDEERARIETHLNRLGKDLPFHQFKYTRRLITAKPDITLVVLEEKFLGLQEGHRKRIVRALGSSKAHSAFLGFLNKIIETDSSHKVKTEALSVIGRRRTPEALKILERAIATQGMTVRSTAQRLLLKKGSLGVPVLKRLAEHTDYGIANWAKDHLESRKW